MALTKRAQEFADAGAAVITVSPQLPEHAQAWIDQDGIAFPVLFDEGNRVARQFGLVFQLPDDLRDVYENGLNLDLEHHNGDDSWELPLPASYVVARSGLITHAWVDPDYTVRPEPDEILAAVR